MTFYHICYLPLRKDQMFQLFFLFPKMKGIQTHPLPTLLGMGMTNTRQKGAREQSGLWSTEECLRTPLYHQLRDAVRKKLFPHYIMVSACKQQPSTEPAQQHQAGGKQWKGTIRHQELAFSEDKQHDSTLFSILRKCFVLGTHGA